MLTCKNQYTAVDILHHLQIVYLFKSLFSKENIIASNPLVIDGFPSQGDSNAEDVSMAWRPHKNHDDVIIWRYFPRYWPFVRGIHWSPMNSQHKGQWRGALVFSLICNWVNGCINNRKAGDLRRDRVHFDATLMSSGHGTTERFINRTQAKNNYIRSHLLYSFSRRNNYINQYWPRFSYLYSNNNQLLTSINVSLQ